MAKKQELSDAEVEYNYSVLLDEFNTLWTKHPKDHSKFAALKNKANGAGLTFRQKDGIIERCNNVINGTYGNSKKGIEFKAS